MTADSIDVLDGLDAGDTIEIDWWVNARELRQAFGIYEGLERRRDRDGKWEWWLLRVNRPDIRTIDIHEIRKLTSAGA